MLPKLKSLCLQLARLVGGDHGQSFHGRRACPEAPGKWCGWDSQCCPHSCGIGSSHPDKSSSQGLVAHDWANDSQPGPQCCEDSCSAQPGAPHGSSDTHPGTECHRPRPCICGPAPSLAGLPTTCASDAKLSHAHCCHQYQSSQCPSGLCSSCSTDLPKHHQCFSGG